MVDVEAELAELRAEGKLRDVATLAIETYGPDVLGFLAAMLRSQVDASDAFAQACENMWRALPRFEGRSSVKTWFYTVARNTALRMKSASADNRRVALSEISEIADKVRTRSALLHFQASTALTEIRDELPEEDRTLLVLRVDREMSWNDVARVLGEADASDDDLVRAAARLRQRFQLIKKTIRERARERGLLAEWLEGDE
jgi:RNA polymerase sigma-70 factor, ECF subfamily